MGNMSRLYYVFTYIYSLLIEKDLLECQKVSVVSPFSSLLGPNICLKFLLSNTLSLDSSFNVRDHVS